MLYSCVYHRLRVAYAYKSEPIWFCYLTSMALVRQQKLLSFTAGLAVAGASYVSTQVTAYVQARISLYAIKCCVYVSSLWSPTG